MKKVVSLILLFLIMTLFSGCTNQNSIQPDTSHQSTSISKNSPSIISTKTNDKDDKANIQAPNYMKEIKDLSDEELLYKYINGLEICLVGKNELIFKNPDEIPSEALFMFFLYTLNNENSSKYEEYETQWFNKNDNLFHIPIKDIKAVLDLYFEHYSLVPTKIQGYSASEDSVCIATILGFGGDVWTRVTDKKFDQDKLTLVVDFYEDNNFQKVRERKEYVIRFYDTGYYLLSVKKE